MLLFLLFRDLQSKNRNHEGKTRRSVTFLKTFLTFLHQNGGVAFFFCVPRRLKQEFQVNR